MTEDLTSACSAAVDAVVDLEGEEAGAVEGETSTVADEEEGDGEDQAKNNVVLLALETSDSDAAHRLRLLVWLYITSEAQLPTQACMLGLRRIAFGHSQKTKSIQLKHMNSELPSGLTPTALYVHLQIFHLRLKLPLQRILQHQPRHSTQHKPIITLITHHPRHSTS